MAKFLDALVPKTESRYTLDDYANWLLESFNYGGFSYPLTTTQSGQETEPIGANFVGHVQGALKANGAIGALELVRVAVFSQARFQFQSFRKGKPQETFGTNELSLLEKPWAGGTTGQLLARMLLDADMAGNYYAFRDLNELVRLRPDWTDILLSPRRTAVGTVGYKRAGYAYYDEGNRGKPSAVFLPDEVAHWAPMPDPLAEYRGMSWLTPVLREVQGDTAYTQHKLKFVDNAATPNLAVTLAKEVSPEQFEIFVEMMDAGHKGIANAYKTLYLGGGADVTVIGADMHQMDFKVVQGAGETRLAAAAGVGAVMAQFSEGLQGSSLNSGNYGAARRRFADVTMRHLWQDACGALEPLVKVPATSRLWYDSNDIPFLQEDAKDAADIFGVKAAAIRTLTDGGYDPDSVVSAVDALDPTLLTHTGQLSVQLMPPGSKPATNGASSVPAATP